MIMQVKYKKPGRYKKNFINRKHNLKFPKQIIKKSAFEISRLASSDEFCLVSFKKTKNNAYCVISQLFGVQKTLWSISGGMVHSYAKTNGRRKTRFTVRMIFKFVLEKLYALGFKYLVIHTSGTTISKRYVFKNFYKRFKIVLLKDRTGNAHNGCRAPSVRRV